MLVFGLWIVWSGHYNPLLLTLGLSSAAGVVFLCWRMQILDREIAPFHWTGSLLRYVPWLALEIVKSNLDVIRRVLDPAMPINPQVIRLQASQTTDLGRVIYANSITLTPGTLTLDAEDGDLTVHALADSGAQGLASGRMDGRITGLEVT